MQLLSAWFSRNRGYIHQVLVCCSVSILPFIYSLLDSWPSLAIKRILDGEAGFSVTRNEISAIVSSNTLAQTLMPIMFGFILVKLGRKTNLILNAIFFIVTWTCITFAFSPFCLVVANFTGGFGCAVALIIGPVYIAEIADKHKRGTLISVYMAALSIGTLFSTSVGIYISYFQLNVIGLVSAVFALISIIAFTTESPYWHLICSNERKAEESFKYYWVANIDENKDTQMSAHFSELKKTVEAEMKSACTYRELFRTPSNIKATVIVNGLALFAGASGAIAVLTYASTTLPKYDGFWQPNPTIALTSATSLITSFISTVLVDTWGRKPLTIVSNIGDAVGSALVAIYFFIDEYTSWSTNDIKWVPHAGVLILYSFCSLGMLNMGHLLAGELYPANVRYYASVLSVCSFAGSCTFFNYIYYAVCDYAGVSVMFFIFTVFNFVATLFSCSYMFETKNLSLAEIQMKLMGLKPKDDAN